MTATRRPRSFRRDDNALAIVETALVLPLLVTIGLGGIELANFVNVHTRISSIALAAADNAARINSNTAIAAAPVREVDINEVFEAVNHQGTGLSMRPRTRIILSSLERNASGGQWIRWQRCWGGRTDAPRYGRAGDGATGTSFPGMGPATARVMAPADSAVMFVEITHNYRAAIFPAWFGTDRLIRYEAAYIVRDRRDLAAGVTNPSPSVTPSTCT